MQDSNRKFSLGALVGLVVGCGLVLIVWQVIPFDQNRSEHDFENGESSSVLPDQQSGYDVDSWKSLLPTTEESLTLNDYVDLLEEKSADQLTHLLIESIELEQDEQIQLFQDLIMSTLTQKSPETALDLIWKFPWNRHQTLTNICVATQSAVDLEQSLEMIQSIPRSYREGAIKTILSSRPELSERDWKGLTEDANVSKLVLRLFREAEAIAHLDKPSEAWDQLLQDDIANEEQKDLLVEIAKARIEEEGFEVLSHFYEVLYLNDRYVLESIIREVLATGPNIAFQTVKSMPYESRNFVLPILVEAWAKQSPKEAYFAVTEIGDYQPKRFYWDPLEEWAKLDPLNLLDSLSDIERVDRTAAVLITIAELVSTNPEEITQRLEEIKKIPGVSDDSVEYTLVSDWSQYDPLEAINWIQEATVLGSSEQASYLRQALRNLIQFDSDKALEIALNQPLDSYFVQSGYVGGIFSELVDEGFLDKAIDVLDELPDAAITAGYMAVGEGLIEVDRLAEALDLTNNLDTNIRESYLRSITISATYQGVQNLIDELTEMPDNETRRYIASELVRENDRRGDVLTEQQLRVVRSLLPAEGQSSEQNDT